MSSKISLCMIVKDEEQNLRRCLASVTGAVDEIIVVNTGSGDGTSDVAVEFGARVISFPWKGNFSDARNASLEEAKGDWILYLDADEEFPSESKDILRRVTADGNVEGYFIKVINYLGGDGWVETCPDLIFRLFRNRPGYKFRGAIHEQIVDVILEINSQARYRVSEDLVILHHGYLNRQIEEKDKITRNLNILNQELVSSPDNRLLRYHYGVELFRAEKYREAAEEFVRAANNIDPQTIYLPKLLRYLVLTYQALKLPEKALETTRFGLRLFPNYADLYYYGGLSSFDQRDYAGAYNFLVNALSMPVQPAYFAPFNGIRGFRSLYYLGRLAEIFCNEEEAIKYYLKSLKDNSFFIPALESITRLLKPREDPEYAKKCLEQICEFCTPQANLMMGQILFKQSVYQLALDYIEKGSPDKKASPEILIWKAICLIQQRRYLEAQRILKGFTPGHHLYPLATLNKAFCFWIRGNRRKLRAITDDLLALGLSEETGAVVSLLRFTSGRHKDPGYTLNDEGMSLLLDFILRALDMGEAKKAVTLLSALSRACLMANARTVGNLFSQYGYPELAEGYFLMHLESNPLCACTHFNLAEIKEEQGEFPEAVNLYRRALELDPREPRHYIRMIRLYEKMRLETLKKAMEMFPNAPVLKDIPKGGPSR